MCCLHCSIVLQKATNYECCGCEEENISIRHTHAFAGIQDRTAINRTHDDWKGVFCKALSVESICASFPQVIFEESGSEAAEQAADYGHEHDTISFYKISRERSVREVSHKENVNESTYVNE
jgi:hypothetical protein